MSFNLYLKIAGIPGDSTDEKHKDWIEFTSWSWALTNAMAPLSGGGAPVGRPDSSELVVHKRLDRASPLILIACASGLAIPDASIECIKAGGDRNRFLTVTLQDVRITAFKPVASVSADSPTEEIGFQCRRIRWSYTMYGAMGNPQGDLVGGWDFAINQKVL
jgi:type VI secretion system secreted protein Hcp